MNNSSIANEERIRGKWDEIRSRERKKKKRKKGQKKRRKKKRNDDVVNEEGEDSFLLIFKSIERIIRGEEEEDILSYLEKGEKEKNEEKEEEIEGDEKMSRTSLSHTSSTIFYTGKNPLLTSSLLSLYFLQSDWIGRGKFEREREREEIIHPLLLD